MVIDSQRVLGSKNLRLALEALHLALPDDSCEMQRVVWDFFSPACFDSSSRDSS